MAANQRVRLKRHIHPQLRHEGIQMILSRKALATAPVLVLTCSLL